VAVQIKASIPRRALRLTGSILVAVVLAVVALMPIGISLIIHLVNAAEASYECPTLNGHAGTAHMGYTDGWRCSYPGGFDGSIGEEGDLDFFDPLWSALTFMTVATVVSALWWLSVRWIHRTFMNPPRHVWRP
jgi:hypothetical protein